MYGLDSAVCQLHFRSRCLVLVHELVLLHELGTITCMLQNLIILLEFNLLLCMCAT